LADVTEDGIKYGDAGSAYVYTRDDTDKTWHEQATLTGSSPGGNYEFSGSGYASRSIAIQVDS